MAWGGRTHPTLYSRALLYLYQMHLNCKYLWLVYHLLCIYSKHNDDFSTIQCTVCREKQVFRVKKSLWGCHPNSNYLLSSVASQDTTTCQNNATTYVGPYIKYICTHTQFHSGMSTQTDCAYIFLS